MTFKKLIHLCSENLRWVGTSRFGSRFIRVALNPNPIGDLPSYIGWILCRGNPRGCPIVGRFSKIDSALSRYESRPTQVQETDNYPGGLEQIERSAPFPTNDSILCRGKGFRSEQRSLFTTTTAKCQHALVLNQISFGIIIYVTVCFQPIYTSIICLTVY